MSADSAQLFVKIVSDNMKPIFFQIILESFNGFATISEWAYQVTHFVYNVYMNLYLQ